MSEPVTVVLLGPPVAWARPRPRTGGGYINPAKQRGNTAGLRVLAWQEMAGRAPFECAVTLSMHAEMPIPASWPKWKKAAALIGEIRPTGTPDISNIIKQIEDAFNGVVYRDDALIVEYGTVRKVYGGQPKVAVTVSPIIATTAPVSP